MADLDVSSWINVLVLGGLAGGSGQAIRTVIGMKKLADEAASKGVTVAELFVPSRLVISLVIGAAAGVLAALNLEWGSLVRSEQVLGIIAAGYAGSDFIEGLMQRVLPTGPSPIVQTNTAAAVPADTAQG